MFKMFHFLYNTENKANELERTDRTSTQKKRNIYDFVTLPEFALFLPTQTARVHKLGRSQAELFHYLHQMLRDIP